MRSRSDPSPPRPCAKRELSQALSMPTIVISFMHTTHKVSIMAKGKLLLICLSGGEFVTNDDGTMSYNGGDAKAAIVTTETPFNDLKLNLAETCDLNQESVTVKYFLPGNKRNLITVKNDKDVKRMIDFHGDAITAEVFVMGTPGFDRSALEMQTNSMSGRNTSVKRRERENQ